jgi:hypothetical protein
MRKRGYCWECTTRGIWGHLRQKTLKINKKKVDKFDKIRLGSRFNMRREFIVLKNSVVLNNLLRIVNSKGRAHAVYGNSKCPHVSKQKTSL